jgi:flagellar motor switch protein FliM
MGVLAAQNWFSYHRKGGFDDHVRRLTGNIQNAPVEFRALLAQTTMRVNDLISLNVGDVITTDKGISRDVLIQVEGKNKFLGQIGCWRGNRAIRITRIAQQLAESLSPEKEVKNQDPAKPKEHP